MSRFVVEPHLTKPLRDLRAPFRYCAPSVARRVQVLAICLLSAVAVGIPSSAAQVSGGWNNLGQGSSASVAALNGKVETMAVDGSRLYLGGEFIDAGGLADADRIASWDGGAWSAVGGGIDNGSVRAIAVDGTNVYAGGSFIDLDGNMSADKIAVWRGSGWEPITTCLPPNCQLGGNVEALLKVGRKLYVGGSFLNLHGIPQADGIARYDLDTRVWEAITASSGDIGGSVFALAPDGTGGVYVGGSFVGAPSVANARFIAHFTGTTWAAMGLGPNAVVREIAVRGTSVYAVGDFINAGNDAGDKVARFDGFSWRGLGATSFFGEATVPLHDIQLYGSHVIVTGVFMNAGGQPKVDGIAAFVSGKWTNVGTDAGGSSGPGGILLAVEAIGQRLYAGGLSADIGGGPLNDNAAYIVPHRPDALIKSTGGFVGDGVYSKGGNQAQTLTFPRGQTGTFTIEIQNDGTVTDAVTLLGSSSSNGFTVKYFEGARDVTTRVNHGSFRIQDLAPGSSQTVLLKVKVGTGVAAGAQRRIFVHAKSLGGSRLLDGVWAIVTAS